MKNRTKNIGKESIDQPIKEGGLVEPPTSTRGRAGPGELPRGVGGRTDRPRRRSPEKSPSTGPVDEITRCGGLEARAPLRGGKGNRIVGRVLVDALIARGGGQVDEIANEVLMVSLIAHGGDNNVQNPVSAGGCNHLRRQPADLPRPVGAQLEAAIDVPSSCGQASGLSSSDRGS